MLAIMVFMNDFMLCLSAGISHTRTCRKSGISGHDDVMTLKTKDSSVRYLIGCLTTNRIPLLSISFHFNISISILTPSKKTPHLVLRLGSKWFQSVAFAGMTGMTRNDCHRLRHLGSPNPNSFTRKPPSCGCMALVLEAIEYLEAPPSDEER